MDMREFVARRIFRQLSQLRGTGRTVTVEIGEAYYQLASYDGNQLLAEISSNQFLPHGAALDGVAQRRLAALGFEPPSEEWPNWNIRFEADSADVVRRVAASMAYALLECLDGDGSELFERLLLEYVESHPDTARDPEWAAVLYGETVSRMRAV